MQELIACVKCAPTRQDFLCVFQLAFWQAALQKCAARHREHRRRPEPTFEQWAQRGAGADAIPPVCLRCLRQPPLLALRARWFPTPPLPPESARTPPLAGYRGISTFVNERSKPRAARRRARNLHTCTAHTMTRVPAGVCFRSVFLKCSNAQHTAGILSCYMQSDPRRAAADKQLA
jgi:hypothetical protein